MASLTCSLETIRSLHDSLSTLYSPSNKSQEVTISTLVSDPGLRLHTLQPNTLQASVILPNTQFLTLHNSPSFSVRINLSLLLDCIQMIPSTTKVSIEYLQPHLVFKTDETTAKVTTLFSEEPSTELNFQTHPTVGEVVINADAIRDMLTEVELTGATTAEICIQGDQIRKLSMRSPAALTAGEPGLISEEQILENDQIEGAGVNVCEVMVDDSCADVMRSFNCKKRINAVYRMQSLKRINRAIAGSNEVKIEMNEEGMLKVLGRVKAESVDRGRLTEDCFVEIIVIAEEIDEDDDDDRDEDRDEDRIDDEMVLGTMEQ